MPGLILNYPRQREKGFKAKETAALGSHRSSSSEMEETQEKTTVLQNYFEQNRDEVLDNWPFHVTSGQKSKKTTT